MIFWQKINKFQKTLDNLKKNCYNSLIKTDRRILDLVQFTQHSVCRMGERVSKGHKTMEKSAESALSRGKDPSDFPKEIRKYLENICLRSNGNFVKVYGNNIYLFNKNVLITVFPIKQNLLRKVYNRVK